jgi:hypothetical protein
VNPTWLTPIAVWVGAIAIFGMNALVPLHRRTVQDTTKSMRVYLASGESLSSQETVMEVGARVGDERRQLEHRWLAAQESREVFSRALQAAFDELGMTVVATTPWEDVTDDAKQKKEAPTEGSALQRRWFLDGSLDAVLSVLLSLEAWPDVVAVSALEITPAPGNRVWVKMTTRLWSVEPGPAIPPGTMDKAADETEESAD